MSILKVSAVLLLACVSWQTAAAADQPQQADVVVYGDAAGGVTAAVQAARMGKKVILVSPFGHLGGMSSSGLGFSDIGNPAILGGISREFYHRIYKHYQHENAWNLQPRAEFKSAGQGTAAFDAKTELASVFEPKVAEAIFDALLKESGAQVLKGRLDLARGVEKSGARITALRLEGGAVIQAQMFIDASYEGDLLAAAGVSHVVGREANAKYGEKGNGIVGPKGANQLPAKVDAYKIKGDPASGLLAGVNPDMGGALGDGDARLQAYCYRMVLTNIDANRIPIAKPKDYDPAAYELLFRAIEAGQSSNFFKTSGVPNGKTDSNNSGGISCDLIGGNYGKDWNWATLDYAKREALAAKHRDWQLGLVWTLQNDPRVPEPIRNKTAQWGLPKDEFADNGHWPYAIYVREARRMVAEVVMTENHCTGKVPVDDPVGLGAYTLDSHHVQRVAVNGMVRNEGDIQTHLNGKPYGISFRAIMPRASECENLLVPWALSASHIAFGSIRMEPVFMVLGQSAGTAACLAIDGKTSVQAVPYAELRARLLKDDQRLDPAPKAP